MAEERTSIVVADAEFLSLLPDIPASSPVGQAVAALCLAQRLVTVADAKHHAEAGYQALVNFPLYQSIPAEATSRQRRARAKALASQAPEKLVTRHAGVIEKLIVIAAAIEKDACIVTSHSGHGYYCDFEPSLELMIFTHSDLPSLV